MSTLESYRYSALDESGKKVSGTEKAASASAAHLMLIQRGLQPIDVKEHKSILKFEITKKKVSRKEIMHFSRQLSVFVEAGIPIMEALELISEETTDKLLKRVLLDMVGELQAGDTFASAAASHPEAFPRYYVAVLESAELTGTLDTVLLELATYLETDIEARSAVTSALIYPAVVAVMAVVTVVVLATFVLPKFRTFFASLNAKLPLPTRMLLSISGFISTWWWAIAGIILLAVVVIRGIAAFTAGPGVARLGASEASGRGKPSSGGHRRACLPRPGVAGHRRSRPSPRHGRHRRGVQQCRLHRGLNHIREQMMEGKGLADPLAETGLFPAAARQMFRVGEETGTLDKQLSTAAAFYHRELEIKVKHFTSLFEPAIIIFMGLIVGFVAVALVSAMYGIYRQVNVS